MPDPTTKPMAEPLSQAIAEDLATQAQTLLSREHDFAWRTDQGTHRLSVDDHEDLLHTDPRGRERRYPGRAAELRDDDPEWTRPWLAELIRNG